MVHRKGLHLKIKCATILEEYTNVFLTQTKQGIYAERQTPRQAKKEKGHAG